MSHFNRPTPTWTAKDVDEHDIVGFNFKGSLLGNETITSAFVTCEAKTGTDAGAAGVLDGGATFDDGLVSQPVLGGLANVTYLMRARAVLSSGRQLVLSAYLPVERLGQ